ncbi:hypothetical protein [Nocardia sp. NPDC057227]|uniref:WXG100-like domain-containing protein n=1 Tax=Nocardia sp. NPDC057227 TaxID=3346056 RepID=UPI0036290409
MAAVTPTPTVPIIVCRANEYTSAGEVFGQISADCTTTHSGLFRVLTAHQGMAGNDSVGEQWAAGYDEAAQLALSTSSNLTTACGQTRDLIVVSAYNHQVAEATASLRALPDPPAPSLSVDPCLPETAAPAAGDGMPEPFGWSLIKDLVGWAWPNGHQDQLNSVKTAWHTASSDFRTVAGTVPNAVDLLRNQQSAEIEIGVQTCITRQADLNELADSCQALGDACGEYAHHLDDAHSRILEELRDIAVETVAAEAVFLALAPVTATVSEWVGNTALAVRIAAKARRIATIIGELAARVARIVTDVVRPLVERMKPLVDKVRSWVQAARGKFLGRSGPNALFSRGGALTNREVMDGDIGLPRTMETIEEYARLAGIDLRGAKIEILDDADTISYLDFQGAIARTDAQGVQLGPASFQDPETLVRTLAHENVHVRQYAEGKINSMTSGLEDEAYAAEDAFVETWRRNTP